MKIYDGIIRGLNEALEITTKNEIIKGAPLGPRVIEVIPNDDFELLLTFNNGEKRIFLVDGADHAMSYVTDEEGYLKILQEFEDKLLIY